VWVDYYRDRSRSLAPVLDPLIRDGRVATCGPVLAEVLQGARSSKQVEGLVQDQQALAWLETDAPAWMLAAELAREARRGQGVVGLADCVIAAVAKQNRCRVLTRDKDFLRLKGVDVELL
jgi:predicted nucleic acid-binding protein